jgi:large subunit ribosomal protein L17e
MTSILSFSHFLVAKARGSHIRIHFKHCREIGQAIKGRTLKDAQQYLENVLQFKDAIPFTKYTGGIGRHSIGKKYKAIGDKVSWPQKATRVFLDLLRNIESNADHKPFPNVSSTFFSFIFFSIISSYFFCIHA